MSVEMENTSLDPNAYFHRLKSMKQETTDEELKSFYDNSYRLLSKAMETGQQKQAKKLVFLIETASKEQRLLDYGIKHYVNRSDVEAFLDKVEGKAIKIIELENYPREIPDDVVEKIKYLKKENLFDSYFIIFTDYTHETSKEVAEERRRKDPILFGVFKSTDASILKNKFYFIADWEDPYCDLTFDKMIDTIVKANINKDPSHHVCKHSFDEIKRMLYKDDKGPIPKASGFKGFLDKVKDLWK